jgi:CBS domain-containing protein
MATVSDLLKVKGKDVFWISVSASVKEALVLMAEKDVGALPVIGKKKLSGFFSERDFARLLDKNDAFPMDTLIQDVMTKKVYTVTPATNCEECMQLMTEKHIRHLPVMEEDQMVGLVSIGDVVKAIISYQKDYIDQLEGYKSGLRW